MGILTFFEKKFDSILPKFIFQERFLLAEAFKNHLIKKEEELQFGQTLFGQSRHVNCHGVRAGSVQCFP